MAIWEDNLKHWTGDQLAGSLGKDMNIRTRRGASMVDTELPSCCIKRDSHVKCMNKDCNIRNSCGFG